MRDEGQGTKVGGQRSGDLVSRTQTFAVDCVKFVDSLPRDFVTQHFARQLLRSATSVAANYRAACRARSNAELHSKLWICEEEADETLFWLDMLHQANRATIDPRLTSEASQLTAMFVAAKKRLRAKAEIRESVMEYGKVADHIVVSELPSPQDP